MAAEQTQTPDQYFKGIVKSALDGGAVVIRGPPRNGPPAERVLALTNIDAPRMGRRPTPSGSPATTDEPYAWEAREHLRKLTVGKSVLFRVVNAAAREYGILLVGDSPATAVDVTLSLVEEGLVKCRENCQDAALQEAQERAKNAGKGVWAEDAATHVRAVTWDVENTRELVERFKGKPISGIVEHVRDGTTLRVMLLPDFIQITLMLSGVRSPSTKLSDGKPDPVQSEAYAIEAHFFTESRLLQRDVEVILESSNNNNFVGSVLHPNGNIAEALLKEGMAKCVDWSIAKVTGGPEKYRAAEKAAKERRVRLWKNYTAQTPKIADKDREFTGKVVEIINGDAMMVKAGKDLKKIHLASIKPPKLDDKDEAGNRTRQKGFRPLYDIPFMFEAREFLRKKVIGHNVQVTVDYVQPARPAQNGEPDYPEKTCCTVVIGGVNIAEALVSKGLATVVRYAADNDQRSSRYDELMQAEDKAIKSGKGMHDKKNTPKHKVNDMTGNLTKCKTFFPSLQRAGKLTGVVEFVASGSRFRVYIPRETCIMTFLLGGISCARSTRTMPSGDVQKGEPYGDECLAHVKEMTMQREVEIEVDSMDKAGNFIGYMWVDGKNLSVHLCQEGFASMHFTAEKAQCGNMIKSAEDSAKAAKKRIWSNYAGEEEKEAVEEEETKTMNEERKVSYVQILVSEVDEEGRVYGCSVKDGPALEKLMDNLREEFRSNPPLAGAYQPRKGDTCAAKFVDGEWYRAKVEKVTGGDVAVLYVDYGNRATVPKVKVARLPDTLQQARPFASMYHLALVSLPSDEEFREEGIKGLKEDLLDRTFNMNLEYRVGTDSYVTLMTPDSNLDVGKALVEDGLLMVERKGGRKLASLQKDYLEAMEKAKKAHLNIWRYGDITADDAKEFGTGK